MTYDANGNLQTLDRYGEAQSLIDQLTYTYLNSGNQIGYITDPTLDVPGVNDYPGSTLATQRFWYDANGYLLRMADKPINTNILYSWLNKPEVIDFGTGEKLCYLYDGTGNKMAKIVKDGSAVTGESRIYAGDFVYDLSGELLYFNTAYGRLVCDGAGYHEQENNENIVSLL